MFPFCYEWHWDMSHIVFMGGLWYALCIIGAGATYVVGKSFIETFTKPGEDEHH